MPRQVDKTIEAMQMGLLKMDEDEESYLEKKVKAQLGQDDMDADLKQWYSDKITNWIKSGSF